MSYHNQDHKNSGIRGQSSYLSKGQKFGNMRSIQRGRNVIYQEKGVHTGDVGSYNVSGYNGDYGRGNENGSRGHRVGSRVHGRGHIRNGGAQGGSRFPTQPPPPLIMIEAEVHSPGPPK